MYFWIHGLVAPGGSDAADGVQAHHAVVLQQLARLGEVLVEMGRADVFEHADRDDAVEALVDVAVVLQADRNAIGEVGLGGALGGDFVLLVRQRHAGRARPGDLRQVERHAAEAAADVEHRMALVDQRLGRQMSLLGELRLVERLPAVLEIGAGILQVGVEEEAVQAPVEIVVVGDVSPRPPLAVALMQPAEPHPRALERLQPAHACETHDVVRAERQEVVEVALQDLQPPVDEQFAKRQLGIEHHPPFCGAVGEAHGDRRPRAVAESSGRAVDGLDRQMAATNKLAEKQRKNRVHGTPLGRSESSPPKGALCRSKGVSLRSRREISILPKSGRTSLGCRRAALTRYPQAPISAPDLSAARKRTPSRPFPRFCRRSFLARRRLKNALRRVARAESGPRRPAPAPQATARIGARSERSKMLGTVLKTMFGSANDRRLKGYRPKIAEINALEPQFEALTDEQLRAKTEEFRAELAAGKTVDDLHRSGFRRRPRGGQTHAQAAALRRPVDRRHGAARGRDRRDAHRRRQDARRHPRRSISTRSPATASTSSRSTTISPAATPSGWARSTISSA